MKKLIIKKQERKKTPSPKIMFFSFFALSVVAIVLGIYNTGTTQKNISEKPVVNEKSKDVTDVYNHKPTNTDTKSENEKIIINDIDILGEGIPNNNFRKLAVCEAKLYRPLRKVKDNEKVFTREKYVINGYIGKNGKITQEDFERIGKNYA